MAKIIAFDEEARRGMERGLNTHHRRRRDEHTKGPPGGDHARAERGIVFEFLHFRQSHGSHGRAEIGRASCRERV